MEVSLEDLGSLKRKISVEVPLSEVEATYESVFAEIKSHIRVDGFRPGKFPRALAAKRFQSLMRQEATKNLLPKYFQQALDEVQVKPATQPNFSNLEIDQKLPFKFQAEFEVIPAFDSPEISGLSLEEKEAELEEGDVDNRIEEMRTARAQVEDKGDEAAEMGDVVTFDFEGAIEGEPFPGNRGTDQRMELGAGQFLKDFEENLKGSKNGEEKSFDLTFPEDYAGGELAGKTARFQVQVKKVEKKVPPELDAAFFSQFGGMSTLEDFRQEVEKQMLQERERIINTEYQESLARQIKEVLDFEVPQALVEQGIHDFEHQLEHNDPEALKDEARLAELKEKETGVIKGNIRLNYVIDEMSRRFAIKVEEKEIQQRFYMQAYMMQKSPEELLGSQLGEIMIDRIHGQMLTGKTLEHLADIVLGKAEAAPAVEPAEAAAEQAEAPAEQAAVENAPPEPPPEGQEGGSAPVEAPGRPDEAPDKE